MVSKTSLRFYKEKVLRRGEDYYSLTGYHHYKAIFIHIPKTGGVSISKAIYGSLGLGHASFHELTKHFTAEQIESYYTFTMVRHPIDRFISAVNYLRGGGISREDIEWAKKYLNPYDDVNDFISKELANHTSNKHHFRTQSSYLLDDAGSLAKIDLIARYENFDVDFQKICNVLGIKNNLQHHNKSKSKYFSASQISDASMNKLHSIYEDDFTNFNYTN